MELDVALMKAHLRLDVDQMNDKEIMEAFQRVSLHHYVANTGPKYVIC